MATLKQQLGAWLIPRLPITRQTFNHLRVDLNALRLKLADHLNPRRRVALRELRGEKNVLVNVGCGPFGEAGWVNLDLYPHPGVRLAADCRTALPLGDNSCAGIHVEMFLEHLDPVEEMPPFLRDCRRCLRPDGILRVIVPDARKFLAGYLTDDWQAMNEISYGREDWSKAFRTKMDALNQVFIQNGEHYGGWDSARLERELRAAGFAQVAQTDWRVGDFPVPPIDREYHRQNGLYFEAQK